MIISVGTAYNGLGLWPRVLNRSAKIEAAHGAVLFFLGLAFAGLFRFCVFVVGFIVFWRA